nr:hypothetical protein [Angustibacter aerolatus]
MVLGVEHELGMEVPERAVWGRTLLAEPEPRAEPPDVRRVLPARGSARSPPSSTRSASARSLQTVMEEISGGRVHYMFNRVGGLKEDLPAGWLGRVTEAVAGVRRRLPDLEGMLIGNEILTARTRGVGVLTRDVAAAYGVSGPIARASGIDLDLRRDEPYLAYGEPVRARGSRPRRDPHRGRLPGAAGGAARAGARVARPRRGLRRPAPLAAPGAGERAAAEGAAGARGPPLHLDRESARRQRLLPGLARRQGAAPHEACARRPSRTCRCCRGCCPAACSATWWPCSARCSSSSATSTSSPHRTRPTCHVPGSTTLPVPRTWRSAVRRCGGRSTRRARPRRRPGRW